MEGNEANHSRHKDILEKGYEFAALMLPSSSGKLPGRTYWLAPACIKLCSNSTLDEFRRHEMGNHFCCFVIVARLRDVLPSF